MNGLESKISGSFKFFDEILSKMCLEGHGRGSLFQAGIIHPIGDNPLYLYFLVKGGQVVEIASRNPILRIEEIRPNIPEDSPSDENALRVLGIVKPEIRICQNVNLFYPWLVFTEQQPVSVIDTKSNPILGYKNFSQSRVIAYPLREGLILYLPTQFLVNSVDKSLLTEIIQNKINKNNGVLNFRIDSACHIGHFYNDQGCDCRWQFLNALDNGFIVLHDALGDGRAWGTLPKAITELWKNADRDPRNYYIPETSTPFLAWQAAQSLYRPFNLEIDRRTLEYYCQVLTPFYEFLLKHNIKFKSITLLSDNGVKKQALENVFGLPIEVSPTLSRAYNLHCHQHIEDKHQNSGLYL